MKLSEALGAFYILPLNQFEIVSHHRDEDPELGEIYVITWTDNDTGESHRQEFVDQEIDISDQIRTKGQFNVVTIEDEEVSFIALRPVKKEELE